MMMKINSLRILLIFFIFGSCSDCNSPPPCEDHIANNFEDNCACIYPLNVSVVLDLSKMNVSQRKRRIEIATYIQNRFIEKTRKFFPSQKDILTWVDPNFTCEDLKNCNIDFSEFKSGIDDISKQFEFKGDSYNHIGIKNEIFNNKEYKMNIKKTFETSYSAGGSNIYNVIRNQKFLLEKEKHNNVIFIISDGEICDMSNMQGINYSKVACLLNSNSVTQEFKSNLENFQLNESGLKNYYESKSFGLVSGGQFSENVKVVLLELSDWNEGVEGKKVLSWIYSDWFEEMHIQKNNFQFSYSDEDLSNVYKMIDEIINY